MTDCIICGRQLPFDGSRCPCKDVEERSYEDKRLDTLYRYLEGDTDNCWDAGCAKAEIEEIERRMYKSDHDTD